MKNLARIVVFVLVLIGGLYTFEYVYDYGFEAGSWRTISGAYIASQHYDTEKMNSEETCKTSQCAWELG